MLSFKCLAHVGVWRYDVYETCFSVFACVNSKLIAKLRLLQRIHLLRLLLNNMAALDDFFPKVNAPDPQNKRAIVRMIRILETRIHKRNLLQEDVLEKQEYFRNILVELENENVSLRHDNNEQKKVISVLEGRIYKLQNHIDSLLYKLNNACDALRNLQQELRDKDRQLKEYMLEKQKIIQRCNDKIQIETDRMAEAMETKLQEQHERLTSCIKKKDDKLRLVRHILTSVREETSDNVTLTSPIASSSRVETAEKATSIVEEESSNVTPINLQVSGSTYSKVEIAEEPNPSMPVNFPSSSTNASIDTIVTKTKLNTKIPVVNPRYQRVQNLDSWIDHRPTGIVPTGTILQPQMQPRKRTIRKLMNPKDFVARSSRYCLFSQEQGADGALETKLYKANVLPTCGGGAQIVFNDIECLTQISPTTTKHNSQIKNGKSSK
ncbi:kinesin-like protein KIF23 isoform X2 [Monomorium pharaonis]|uniref:kinesin-like protein KIF23 isoform X2 n=1 Tax=Monomorium pharaonis TaxID=307658 RepID=UPI001746A1DC|nr:kinesin-like protein KIF23 isoform X2 [Monomorium pharaonis]